MFYCAQKRGVNVKKFLIIAALLTVLLIGTAYAENQEDSGPAAAPAEICHDDSIYYM